MSTITRSLRFASAAAFGGLLLFAASTAEVHAQKKPKSLDTASASVVERKRTVRRTPTGRPQPTANVARFASVRIGPAIPESVISVNGKPVKADFDQSENQFILDDLRPGKYTITYDPPDYVTMERIATLKAGSEVIWTPSLKPATVPLAVTALPGAKLYVNDVYRGETLGDGTIKAEVKAGNHQIKLVKDGYEEYRQTALFDYGSPVAINARLVPRASSAEFSDDFDINLKRWTMPASGWSSQKGRLTLSNAPTLGYATNINYRDIAAMAFHLRLDNGGGAAWAVRAKDPNNYYLFYLSGPRGRFPGKFNTYVVRDGQFDVTDPVSSVQVIDPLTVGGEYQIEVAVAGNVVTHTITPSQTGKAINLGAFEDKDNLFTYGGIGFRTVGTEVFSIDDLFVQPK